MIRTDITWSRGHTWAEVTWNRGHTWGRGHLEQTTHQGQTTHLGQEIHLGQITHLEQRSHLGKGHLEQTTHLGQEIHLGQTTHLGQRSPGADNTPGAEVTQNIDLIFEKDHTQGRYQILDRVYTQAGITPGQKLHLDRNHTWS